jgi:predicted acylesterase/phospholipase RssA
MLFGVGYQSFSIGAIIEIVLSLDRDNEELEEQIQTIKEIKNKYNMSNLLFYKL